MKITKILPLLLLLLLSFSLVSAGSLVGQAKINVESNVENIDGDSIVVTWSSTPSANDYLILNDATIPEGYELQSEITIDVEQPEFAQEFEVFYPLPVNEIINVQKSFSFFGSTNPAVNAEKCIQSMNNYIDEKYPGKQRLVGTGTVGSAHIFGCTAEVVLANRQLGWVGELTHTGWDYEQVIDVEGLDRLKLQSNQEATQLTDSINGVATARLLNFGLWLNAELSDNNVYAFHDKSTVEGDWNPVYLSDEYLQYNSLLRQFQAHFTNKETVWTDIRPIINEFNVLARDISLAQEPTFWDNGKLDEITRNGNQMSVPIDQDVLVSEIQLILKGSSIGLVVPAGEPRIINVESGVTLTETESTTIEYEVENIGSERGSFFLQVFCGDEIGSDRLTIQLNADEKDKGTISLTAKSSELSGDFDKTCVLRMTESTTNAYDEEDFDVTIEQKSNCVAGEQSSPYTSDDGQTEIINILDKECNVVDTLECSLLRNEFKLIKGVYECVPKTGGEEDKEFNPTVLIVTAILSLIGFGLVFYSTTPLSKWKPKEYPVGTILRVVLGLTVAGLIFWFVPQLVQIVVDMFSFFI